MSNNTTLNRSLSLPMMVLYGLGTTVGAGIYALVGELAGVAGYLAPAAFLVASLLAGLTAMSFAELSGRFPLAAGAALYVQNGFSSTQMARLTGLVVVLAGLVSAAALLNGFVGYFHEFFNVDRSFIILLVTVVLSAIAIWGIAESVTIASVVTLVEIAGLLWIIGVSRSGLAQLPDMWVNFIPTIDTVSLASIYAGTLLAFYAFIGFEDMVDVAEEVKDVKRNLPIAILLTLGITTLLYVLIMIVAVLAMPPEILAKSKAPLALLFEHYTGGDATIISIVGMFAIINGALIQIIMASRVLYGLSSRNQLPRFLSAINPRTRTPIYATLVVSAIVLALALTGRLASLAEATSVIMLSVFSIVNLALWKIKRHDPSPEGVIIFPRWMSLVGFIVSFGFVLSKLSSLLLA